MFEFFAEGFTLKGAVTYIGLGFLTGLGAYAAKRWVFPRAKALMTSSSK